MDNKKPKKSNSTGFHGNQYVDSQGRHRATVLGTQKTGAKRKTSGGKGK